MARFAWVIKALSPRDGGWVHVFGDFKNEEMAWTAIQMFCDLMVAAGDYVTINVVKTIRF